jgi:WD40 repeat protein
MELKCFVNGCEDQVRIMWELNKKLTFSCNQHKIDDSLSMVLSQKFDPLKVPSSSSRFSNKIVLVLILVTVALMSLTITRFLIQQNQYFTQITKEIETLKMQTDLNYKFYLEIQSVKDLLENSDIDFDKKKTPESSKVSQIFTQRQFSQKLGKQETIKALLTKDLSLTKKINLITQNLGILLFDQESEVLSIAHLPESPNVLFGLMNGVLVELNLFTHTQEMFNVGKSRIYGITATSENSLVYLTGDTQINVFSPSMKKVIKSVTGHSHWILSTTISADEKFLVTGSCDRFIKIWDQFKIKELASLSGHSHDIWALTVSDCNSYLVSGAEDKQVILWDLHSKTVIHKFTGHTAAVYSVQITKDLQQIVSGGGDGSIRVWDINLKQQIHSFEHAGLVRSILLLENDKTLLTISGKTLKVWDFHQRHQIIQLNHTANLISLKVTQNLKYAITGDVLSRVWVWDLNSKHLLWVFGGAKANIRWAVVSKDSKFLAIGEIGLVRLWSLDHEKQIQTIVGKEGIGTWGELFDIERFLEVLS